MLPTGLYAVTGHTAHVINNKLYIFFGQNDVHSFLHLIQVYDISKYLCGITLVVWKRANLLKYSSS